MLRKVANGVWWIEDADGMPTALVTALADGTPLAVAEQWWTASHDLLHDLTNSDSVRDWAKQQIPNEDDRAED
jgi:hypothetical protein